MDSGNFAVAFVLFALIIGWATGAGLEDVGLVKGAAMLVKIPFEIAGMLSAILPGGFGAAGAFAFMAMGVFPLMKRFAGEEIFNYTLVATVLCILSGTFF